MVPTKHTADVLKHIRVRELLQYLKGRRLPVIHEEATIEAVLDAMIDFDHSRLVYVVNQEKRLTGTISLGILIRHVFSPNHEPRIHPRLIIGMITAEKARDIMRKNLVTATEDEELRAVLKKMIKMNVKEIPVLNDNHNVIGDLTMTDLLAFIARLSREGEDGYNDIQNSSDA